MGFCSSRDHLSDGIYGSGQSLLEYELCRCLNSRDLFSWCDGTSASIVFLSGTQDLKAISSNTDQPGTVTFRPSAVLFYDQYCFHAVDIRRFDHVFPTFLCRSLGAIYFAYLLVMVSIHAIGLIVASLSPSEKATGAINSAIFFPMFFQEQTVPYEILPTGLQKVADVMPLTQGIKLLKAVTFHEETGIFFTITLLVVITLIGLFVAIRYFRWE